MPAAAIAGARRLTCGLLMTAAACAAAGPASADVAPADPAGASAAPAVPQTLPQLVEALKHGNPQLEQARQAYLAARQLVPQVSSLPAPQFSLL
ncbi:MAG: hypothetical protein P4L83_14590, partial [Nevskia sp.]|nr:hypothetical protein [Nevskia sp.]